LLEAFGSGTACVVCPIESFVYKDQKLRIPTMDNGAPIMSRFSKELNDIQYGRVEHKWAPVIA
jgi:branched-chain amino acid aminotransferase